jgi:AraC-like DNA-binding protein
MLKEVSRQLNDRETGFSVLDDVMDTLRVRGSIFFHSSLAAPWGMSLSPITRPRFHIALEGGFFIGTEDTQISVEPMDIVMLPNGDMHWIADQLNRELVPSERAGEACELGMPFFQNGEITNRLMCGLVDYEDAISHPIISALPKIFHLSDIQDEDNIWSTVKLIDAEVHRINATKSIIIDRLTEVLFIQLLQNYVSKNEHLTGFLAALQEPRLAQVLQLIHENPEEHWTLDIFSDRAGMSRATLQRKFKAGLGVSPMTYLGRWRVSKAYQLVKYSSLSLDSIADSIGFSDARTLRTAFARHFGFTPSALRKGKNWSSTGRS